MKRILLLLLHLTLASFLASGETFISHTDGSISTVRPADMMSRTVTETDDGFIVSYSIAASAVTTSTLTSGSILSIEGFSSKGSVGMPKLPFRIDPVELPLGATAEVIPMSSEYIEVAMEVAPFIPAQPEIPEASINSVTPISSYSGFYPSTPVASGKISEYRKQLTQNVEITPVLYNMITRKVRLYSSVSYRVVIDTHQQSVQARAASLASGSGSAVSNYSLVGPTGRNACVDAGYLIISTPSLEYQLERFARWKRLLGFNVEIVTRDVWTPEDIKATVRDRYERDNSLMYLLLVGDNDHVPGQSVSCENVLKGRSRQSIASVDSNVSPLATLDDPYIITDFYYGCMGDEDDTTPDIYRGRWATSDYFQVQNIVDKIIYYESTPVTDASFYRKSAHCAYFQYDPDNYFNGHVATPEMFRFVQTSEDVRNYMQDSLKNQSVGKEVSRVYWIDPTNNWTNSPPKSYNRSIGPFEPIPDETVAELQKDKSFEDLYAEIEDGRHYVLYRGHGLQTELISQIANKPNFSISKASWLGNAEWQPLFFSICCSSGDFRKHCFAQSLLENISGGAIGVFAASDTGYKGFDDALTFGIFNSIWPKPGLSPRLNQMESIDFSNDKPVYRLGEILDKATAVVQSNYVEDNVTGLYTREIFHCFGDPSMMFMTEEPKAFESAEYGIVDDYVCVDLGNDEGFISFYDHVTGISRRFYGQSANYKTPRPENVSIAVTGHNRMPLVVNGEEYIPDGETPWVRPNRIMRCSDMGSGVIQVDYTLAPEVKGAYIVVVNLANNYITAQMPCTEQQGTVGAHVGYGAYVVSLMVDNYPNDNVRIIVSHN
ncbi:MAG: hypothetical protein K2G01_00745 [Paramuribaculum sp.]|nr:hypothetical protein [Paramuribaculum sp.]MDE6323985.1 hypothetical protein [Paramuribaculum sp.]